MAEHPTDEQPIRYMERTRLYYRALGYETDYIWSTFDDVPFVRLGQPLPETNVALLTTASPPDRSNRAENGRKSVWVGRVAAPPEAFMTDVAWDRESTHTDDRESFLPIEAAKGLAQDDVFAGLTEHFVGVPTDYSQTKTITSDAPEVLRLLREDGADAAILLPL